MGNSSASVPNNWPSSSVSCVGKRHNINSVSFPPWEIELFLLWGPLWLCTPGLWMYMYYHSESNHNLDRWRFISNLPYSRCLAVDDTSAACSGPRAKREVESPSGQNFSNNCWKLTHTSQKWYEVYVKYIHLSSANRKPGIRGQQVQRGIILYLPYMAIWVTVHS